MNAGSPPPPASADSAGELVARLSEWKSRYGAPETGELEGLLAATGSSVIRDPRTLIRLHETLLFLRAYPRNAEVARLADRILFSMSGRVAALRADGVDPGSFEEPEISGIAGTGFTAVFSHEVARRLALRHAAVEIDWEAYDEPDRLGPAARRFLPLLEEDWPVEAHPPFRQWIESARPRGGSDLRWLLERLAKLDLDPRGRADLYESLALPLRWELGDSPHTRSRLRLGTARYYHRDPLLRRRDVSLWEELEGPPFTIERLTPREARRILDITFDTSAMRYRELYGFTHPDGRVFRARAGRGVEICFWGVPAAWRLPLRAYHAGVFFKNGVPAGYVEVLSLFDRAEAGFNLYYTFREGESAWLYARLLHLFRQTLGVNTFSVDPYQIGHLNEEAVESGAFWFYRKLGFRPVDETAARLVAGEERRMARAPGHRSSRRTLEKLAVGYVLYDGPGATPGMWDRFRVRNVGLAAARAAALHHGGDPARMARWAEKRVSRALGAQVSGPLVTVLGLLDNLPKWPAAEKSSLLGILKAKHGADESRYLRLMQQHPRLRAAFLELGAEP